MSTPLNAINTGLKVEASINVANVTGLGEVVFPRLAFQVKLNINEEVGGFQQDKVLRRLFGTLTGEFLIGAEKIADIKTYSVNRSAFSGQRYPIEVLLYVEIPLDARRIEWLERHRAGKSFEATLRIALQVQIWESARSADFPCKVPSVSTIEGDIPFTVPDTHWRERVLPGLGYGKVMVVELPAVSLESCKSLEHSFKALENAQKQFNLGLYDETAGSCRVALEQFIEPADKGDSSGKTILRLKKSWESRLGDATYQWLDSALGAIKTATNKSHHSPHNHFNRLGAQMLLMVTTALISYAAQYNATINE